MPIIATCPSCGHERQIPDQYAGKKIKCSNCSEGVVVPQLVPVLELAPSRAKSKTGFPVWPIIVGSFIFLLFIGLLLIVSLSQAPRIAPNLANETEPFAQEGPIQVGKFKIDCVSSELGDGLPLMDVHGIGLDSRSVGLCLLLKFSIENITDTEILYFAGLDKGSPELQDSFGNSYAQIHWEGYAFAHAVHDPQYIYNGTSVHPRKKKLDYLVFKPPFEKAKQLTLTLSAKPLGGVGMVHMLIGSDFSQYWKEEKGKEERWEKIRADNERLRKEREQGIKNRPQ